MAAELAKRGILPNILPEGFPDADVAFTDYNGDVKGFIQVKSMHPDRANSCDLGRKADSWINAPNNHYLIAVWLGSPKLKESPVYWIATKKQVGKYIKSFAPYKNRERRFAPDLESKLSKWPYLRFPKEWRNRWDIFDVFSPKEVK